MITILRHFIILLIFIPALLRAQNNVIIDRIVAVVGGNEILQSDIESQYLQLLADKQPADKCDIFESLLTQKLVLNQAQIDSVEVNDVTVELQLENRLKYFIKQIGSKEKLEAYFKKSYFQIKEDMREPMKEQLIMQKMQDQITGDVKTTPSEVAEYYNSLNKDSVPVIKAQVEYLEIAIYPPYTAQSIYEIKQELLALRKRILEGEKFSTLAYLYSDDAASARNGGEIGLMSKGELDPEYAKAAFNLKLNGVSNIVETQFGYHIIQLIDKTDDRINTRHILKKPKTTDDDMKKVLTNLDSIRTLIKSDSLTFEKAAFIFSHDKNSRLNGGKVINPANNSTKFELEQLSQEDYYVIKKLNVGEISEPFLSKDESNKDIFKIIKLVYRSNPHSANLKDDYQMLQELATETQKKKKFQNWIVEKQKDTYIHVDNSYKSCNFKNNGWIKQNIGN